MPHEHTTGDRSTKKAAKQPTTTTEQQEQPIEKAQDDLSNEYSMGELTVFDGGSPPPTDPKQIMYLQRTIGNQATMRLLNQQRSQNGQVADSSQSKQISPNLLTPAATQIQRAFITDNKGGQTPLTKEHLAKLGIPSDKIDQVASVWIEGDSKDTKFNSFTHAGLMIGQWLREVSARAQADDAQKLIDIPEELFEEYFKLMHQSGVIGGPPEVIALANAHNLTIHVVQEEYKNNGLKQVDKPVKDNEKIRQTAGTGKKTIYIRFKPEEMHYVFRTDKGEDIETGGAGDCLFYSVYYGLYGQRATPKQIADFRKDTLSKQKGHIKGDVERALIGMITAKDLNRQADDVGLLSKADDKFLSLLLQLREQAAQKLNEQLPQKSSAVAGSSLSSAAAAAAAAAAASAPAPASSSSAAPRAPAPVSSSKSQQSPTVPPGLDVPASSPPRPPARSDPKPPAPPPVPPRTDIPGQARAPAPVSSQQSPTAPPKSDVPASAAPSGWKKTSASAPVGGLRAPLVIGEKLDFDVGTIVKVIKTGEEGVVNLDDRGRNGIGVRFASRPNAWFQEKDLQIIKPGPKSASSAKLAQPADKDVELGKDDVASGVDSQIVPQIQDDSSRIVWVEERTKRLTKIQGMASNALAYEPIETARASLENEARVYVGEGVYGEYSNAFKAYKEYLANSGDGNSNEMFAKVIDTQRVANGALNRVMKTADDYEVILTDFRAKMIREQSSLSQYRHPQKYQRLTRRIRDMDENLSAIATIKEVIKDESKAIQQQWENRHRPVTSDKAPEILLSNLTEIKDRPSLGPQLLATFLRGAVLNADYVGAGGSASVSFKVNVGAGYGIPELIDGTVTPYLSLSLQLGRGDTQAVVASGTVTFGITGSIQAGMAEFWKIFNGSAETSTDFTIGRRFNPMDNERDGFDHLAHYIWSLKSHVKYWNLKSHLRKARKDKQYAQYFKKLPWDKSRRPDQLEKFPDDQKSLAKDTIDILDKTTDPMEKLRSSISNAMKAVEEANPEASVLEQIVQKNVGALENHITKLHVQKTALETKKTELVIKGENTVEIDKLIKEINLTLNYLNELISIANNIKDLAHKESNRAALEEYLHKVNPNVGFTEHAFNLSVGASFVDMASFNLSQSVKETEFKKHMEPRDKLKGEGAQKYQEHVRFGTTQTFSGSFGLKAPTLNSDILGSGLSASIGAGFSVDVTYTSIEGDANPYNDGDYINLKFNFQLPFGSSKVRKILEIATSLLSRAPGAISELKELKAKGLSNTKIDKNAIFMAILRFIKDEMQLELNHGLGKTFEAHKMKDKKLNPDGTEKSPAEFLELTPSFEGSTVQSVEMNLVKRNASLWDLQPWGMQYVRFSMGRSQKLGKEIKVPVYEGIEAVGGASFELNQSGATHEVIGNNTITYLQAVYSGLSNSPAKWDEFLNSNQARVKQMIRKIAQGDSVMKEIESYKEKEPGPDDENTELYNKVKEAATSVISKAEAYEAATGINRQQEYKNAVKALTEFMAAAWKLDSTTSDEQWSLTTPRGWAEFVIDLRNGVDSSKVHLQSFNPNHNSVLATDAAKIKPPKHLLDAKRRGMVCSITIYTKHRKGGVQEWNFINKPEYTLYEEFRLLLKDNNVFVSDLFKPLADGDLYPYSLFPSGVKSLKNEFDLISIDKLDGPTSKPSSYAQINFWSSLDPTSITGGSTPV